MPNIFRAKAAVLRNRRLESVSSDCAMGIQASRNIVRLNMKNLPRSVRVHLYHNTRYCPTTAYSPPGPALFGTRHAGHVPG